MHARASLAFEAFVDISNDTDVRAKPRRRPVDEPSPEELLQKFMPGLHNASRFTQLQHAVGEGQKHQRASVKMNDSRHLLERATLTVARLKVASKMRRDKARREQVARLKGQKRMIISLQGKVAEAERDFEDHKRVVDWHLARDHKWPY